MATVAVIDYGMGNLHSIAKALKTVSPESDVMITAGKKFILSANYVVFPGVGAIRDCMHTLTKSGLDETIREVASKGTPLLAICIGMQALLEHSEENGGIDCLGVLPGKVVKFATNLTDNDNKKLKIPHIGWNKVNYIYNKPLFINIEQNERFYFVHSYHSSEVGNNNTIATCNYPNSFPCALKWENIVAVQFHPEKSQRAGLQLLKNFLNWDGKS
ncbi:MAG: imidazole glycerol phosphate synthase subunit HisH [Cycloclasticus sp. symbiont of Poecilosclerida sp. M]|nr:MAG: imidazole glycerol phosphate synthase subunit HisH [Cycloclasticus sp. symbiont of Poecilosclerida sp. M]